MVSGSTAVPAGAPGPGRRDDLRAVAAELGPLASRDRPLGALTTYRVGGRAALYVEAGTEADLEAVRRALAGRRVPVLVLGRGSNLLVADAGFPGLVVRLGPGFDWIRIPPGPATDPVTVRAGGATGLPVLARRTVDAGLTGLEWAVGVPGSVGGGVRMNAGGHGSDTSASIVRYRWFDLAGGGGEDAAARLGHGYRRSTISATEVVLWAEFSLSPGDRVRSREALAEIVRWRREHQPGGSNAGSVFANPPGASSGQLVEAAGLKGHRLGTARVSEKHANFIQADEGGSADDVYRLIRHVRAEVARRSGVRLELELQLVGFTDQVTSGDPEPGRANGEETA